MAKHTHDRTQDETLTESEQAAVAEQDRIGANDSRYAAALKTAVDTAVKDLRTQTSKLHDLQDKKEKGEEITKAMLGEVKVRVDAVVQDLVTAAGLT